MDAHRTTPALSTRSDAIAARERRPARAARSACADFEREVDRTQRARVARRERARTARREQAIERDRSSDAVHGPRADSRAARVATRARSGEHLDAGSAGASSEPPSIPESALAGGAAETAESGERAAPGSRDSAAVAANRANDGPVALGAPAAAASGTGPIRPPDPARFPAPSGAEPAEASALQSRSQRAESAPPTEPTRVAAAAPRDARGAEARSARPAPSDAGGPAAPPHDDLPTQVRLQLVPCAGAATIQLAPASLGRVLIRLSVERGRVRAELVAERRATLDSLARDLSGLRRAFASHGLDVGAIDLSLAAAPHELELPSPRGTDRAGASEVATRAALSERIQRAAGVDTYA